MACFAMTFAGCSKEEAPPQTDSGTPEVILDFTVGERDGFGPDTKARKTDWAEGDQILVFYKFADGGWMFGESPTYSVLTYDGTAWSQANTGMSLAFLSGGYQGEYYAIHYRGTVGFGTIQDDEVELTGYEGGEFMYCSGTFETKGQMPTGQVLFGITLSDINLTLDSNLYQISVADVDEPLDLSIVEGKEKYMNAVSSLSIEYNNPLNINNPSAFIQLPHYACQSGMLCFDLANSCLSVKAPDNYAAKPVYNAYDAQTTDVSFCFYIAESNPGPIQTKKYRFTLTYTNGNELTYTRTRTGGNSGPVDDYLTGGYAYRLPTTDSWTVVSE